MPGRPLGSFRRWSPVGRGDDAMVDDAVAFFRTGQGADGAFGSSPGSPLDASTTGLVISALIAAGENPKATQWGDAVSGLLAFQNESGAFRRTDGLREDDFTSTISALVALAGAYLPVLPTA
ncbi:MAG: hypothetical protein QOJ59_5347 [Thermomicrobiales bacterium]|nr:hypothetical protein [Thermomicrobiales bacterium]